MKSRLFGLLALFVLALALTACNDSSSGNATSASGAVAAAPLENAKVFAGTTHIGTTDPKGKIVFNSNLSSVDFPTVVYSKGGTFKTSEGIINYAGTLKGVMETSTSAAYLTPAHTLVAQLYEEGMSLDTAEERVSKIFTKEMGLTKVHPLANPLSNPNESEIVSQALMAVLGLTDDSAGPLLGYVEGIANAMHYYGAPFTGALVKANAAGPFASAKKPLAEFVADRHDSIVNAAKEVLGSAADEKVLKDNAEITKPAAYPVAIFMKATKGDPRPIMTVGSYEFEFSAAVLSNAIDTTTGQPLPYSDQAITIAVQPAIGEISHNTENNTFTYIVKEDELRAKGLPLSGSFTLMAGKGEDIVTQSYQIKFVDKTSLDVLHTSIWGSKLYKFTSEVDHQAHALGENEFVAGFWTVNKLTDLTDLADLTANIDVRFTAPEGFQFEHMVDGTLTHTDSYLIKKIDNVSSAIGNRHFTAQIHESDDVKLVTTDAVKAGRKLVGIEVIDQVADVVLKKALGEIIFLQDGAEQQPAELTLSDVSIKIGRDDVTSEIFTSKAPLTLNGKFKTWESLSRGNVDLSEYRKLSEEDALSGKGKFYIVSNAKDAIFYAAADGSFPESNIEIKNSAISISEKLTEIVDGYEHSKEAYDFTIDLGNIHYSVPTGTKGEHALRLIYVPESGETVHSRGGLTLDIDTTQ